MLNGFCFTGIVESGNYTYSDPIPLDENNLKEIMGFVQQNIEKYPEIRIVDSDDCTTMQFINKRMIFPILTTGGQLVWNSELQTFTVEF